MDVLGPSIPDYTKDRKTPEKATAKSTAKSTHVMNRDISGSSCNRGPSSKAFFSFFLPSLENKLLGIHQTSFLPVEALEFSELKTPLVYTVFSLRRCGIHDGYHAWTSPYPLARNCCENNSPRIFFGNFSWILRPQNLRERNLRVFKGDVLGFGGASRECPWGGGRPTEKQFLTPLTSVQFPPPFLTSLIKSLRNSGVGTDKGTNKSMRTRLWHTNPDSYAIRTPTFMPYEPILLGMGAVFNVLRISLGLPKTSRELPRSLPGSFSDCRF